MKFQTTLFILFFGFQLFAQKTIEALHISEKIHMDGNLNESSWKIARSVSGFTQIKPVPGKASARETKVAMLYSHDAVYVSAICYDNKDSISKVLSLRDDYNANLDVFSISIDTYNDNQNGFYFAVTSQGVQLDAKMLSTDFNDQLNLVWNSKVTITDSAWIAEIRIPFSAIRFPNKKVQSWGINFGRQISRFREESTWHPVNPDLENYLLESGDVVGIENIDAPLRLALMPYLSTYVNHSKENGFSKSINGGMDIKYGLNEALTLDVTLVPDFGQVVFDKQVLNLSPFEIQFNENRQFFTEGTELFNKAGLFYSRRIGVQAPYSVLKTLLTNDEQLENVPTSTQLYNASKLSGRLKNGLGIGVFNGITAPQYAKAINYNTNEERSIMVNPLTNYNVFVLDQNLKNNSSVTFTNTNVWRAGNFYDANVSAFNFKLNTKNNNYSVEGGTAISAKLQEKNEIGHNWNIYAGKNRGSVIYGASYFEESNTYDPNDLGFNPVNNRRIIGISGAYRNFKPKWQKLNKIVVSGSASYNRLYSPNVYTSAYINSGLWVVSKTFNAAGFSFNGALTEARDYFEPRTWGKVFNFPRWRTFGSWISSNYQKRFALDAGWNYVFVDRENWWETDYYLNPRFRINDHLFLIPSWTHSFQLNAQGFAVPFGEAADTSSAIIFGTRNRIDATSGISLDCNITNRMGLTFRLRHYRSAITYSSFSELRDDGTLNPLPNYSGLDANGKSAYNINFNAFTIDMMYRWVFQPGSEINIVWKNSIFTSDDRVADLYWNNLRATLNNGPTNSLSVKVIYWLDAQQLKGLKHKQNS